MLVFLQYSACLSASSFVPAGEIPDAAFIHAARKRRQMARELGGDGPLVETEVSNKRLVHEDEEGGSDDEDEKRIVFSGVKQKSQRQKIAEEIGECLCVFKAVKRFLFFLSSAIRNMRDQLLSKILYELFGKGAVLRYHFSESISYPCDTVGIEGSDDEALDTEGNDEEVSRWEQEQIRKGISIPQVSSLLLSSI